MGALTVLLLAALALVVLGGNARSQCGPGGCPMPQWRGQVMLMPPQPVQQLRPVQPAAVNPAVPRVIHRLGNLTFPASGVLVEKRSDVNQAVVLTAAHLFDHGTGDVEVRFPNGESFWAIVQKLDKASDVAALLIRRPTVDPIPVADRPPQTGETVTLHGYPAAGYGAGNDPYRSVSGAWSGVDAAGQGEALLTAAPGYSGGPMLDRRGRVCALCWATCPGRTFGPAFPRLRAVLWAIRPGIVIPRGPLPRYRMPIAVQPPAPPAPPSVSPGGWTPPPTVTPPVAPAPPAASEGNAIPPPISADVAAMLEKIGERLTAQEAAITALRSDVAVFQQQTAATSAIPGPPGPSGPPGKDGAPATIDYEALRKALPAIKIQTLNPDGSIHQEVEARLGDLIRLKPIAVKTEAK